MNEDWTRFLPLEQPSDSLNTALAKTLIMPTVKAGKPQRYLGYFSLYAVSRFGKATACFDSKHSFIAKYGITSEMTFYADDRQGNSFEIYGLIPFISGGYELVPKRNVFRIEVYVLHLGPNTGLSPVLPWLGISYGRKF